MTPTDILASLQHIVDSPEVHKRQIISELEKLIKNIGEKL